MENNNDIKTIISQCIKKGNIAFKKHAFVRMEERSIRIADILLVLKNGEIIKKYDEDKPFPSYLILGYDETNRPIHVILAIDKGKNFIWIITVYEPDKNIWDSEFKRRIKI